MITSYREKAQPALVIMRLTYSHINDMFFHMKTTLNIDDQVVRRLKAEAARQGRTISEMVEAALRMLLATSNSRASRLPQLPRFKSRALVDVSDREALYHAMEGR